MVPLINAIEIQEACEDEKVDCILAKSYFVGHAHDATGFFYRMTNYYMERFLYLVNND